MLQSLLCRNFVFVCIIIIIFCLFYLFSFFSYFLFIYLFIYLFYFIFKSLLVTRPTHKRPHGSRLGTRGISFEFTHTFEIIITH